MFKHIPKKSDIDLHLYAHFNNNAIDGLEVHKKKKKSTTILCPDRSLIIRDTKLESDKGFKHIHLTGGFNKPKESKLIGDCLVKDTLILTNNGIYTFDYLNYKYNLKSSWNEVNERDFTKVFKSGKKKVVSILTDSGFRIQGSPNHKIAVLKGTDKVWKKFKEVIKGDNVVLDFNTKYANSNYDLSDYSIQEFYRYKYRNTPQGKVRCRECGEKHFNLSSHMRKHGINIEQYKIIHGDVPTMGRKALLSLTAGITKNPQFKKFKKPKSMNKSLALVLGFLTGANRIHEDRHRRTIEIPFRCEKSSLTCLNAFVKCFPDCKVKIHTKNRVRKNPVYTLRTENCKDVLQFLYYCGFNLNIKEKAIPYSVLLSSEMCVREFLRGYFDTCGICDKTLKVNSVSMNYLRHLQTVLMSFGLMSSIRYLRKGEEAHETGFTCMLELNEGFARQFCFEIGFYDLNKQKKISNGSRHRSKKMFIDGVRTATKNVSKKVIMFDLNITTNHMYKANGFIVHNSGSTFKNISKVMTSKSKRVILPEYDSFTKVFFLAWLGKYKSVASICELYNSDLMLNNIYSLSLLGILQSYKSKMNTLTYTMCNCPICTTIGYLDVYQVNNERVKKLLMWHNIFTLNNYTQCWSNIAKKCNIGEYIDWVDTAIKQDGMDKAYKRFNRSWFKDSINFIDTLKGKGEKVAIKQFKSYMGATMKGPKLNLTDFIN